MGRYALRPGSARGRACRRCRRARASPELVTNERPNDRKAGPLGRLVGDPPAVVGDLEHRLAVRSDQHDADVMPAVLERIAEQLGEDERQSGGAIPCQAHRLELGRHLAARPDPLHEHRPEPVEELREIDVLVPLLGQHLVDGRDREDPVDRVHQRLPRIDVLGIARLQPQQRRDRLQVVLDAMVDLLGEHTAHDGAPVLERDGCLLRDRAEQLAVGLGERGRPVRDELPDLPAAPPQRLADRVRVGLAFRPGDRAVLEHERRARRRERVHSRLHDRLERLLEVQRLRHGLGDPRQRLELVHTPLRLLVQLRMLDRLGYLRGDHEQQVDLVRA